LRSNISSVAISASTGEGICELFCKIEDAAVEFEQTYLPELQKFAYFILFF
jgi:hypothetical protein